MTRKLKTVDYEKTLDLQISLRDVLPPNHLACFIVDVITQLDLSAIYNQYSDQMAPGQRQLEMPTIFQKISP